MLHRQASDPGEALRGLGRPGQIAREDGADALALETAGQPLGLGDAARRERVVRQLDGPRGVAERLAVPDQEDQTTFSRRRTATSAAL
ncbi:MAG TPA: hypothetical protein VIF59_01770 [Methylomirabilota bacterium]